MAQKLHSEYGFSYDLLKVLLGGWNGWVTAHDQDPNGYPIETGPNPYTLPLQRRVGDQCAQATY